MEPASKQADLNPHLHFKCIIKQTAAASSEPMLKEGNQFYLHQYTSAQINNLCMQWVCFWMPSMSVLVATSMQISKLKCPSRCSSVIGWCTTLWDADYPMSTSPVNYSSASRSRPPYTQVCTAQNDTDGLLMNTSMPRTSTKTLMWVSWGHCAKNTLLTTSH